MGSQWSSQQEPREFDLLKAMLIYVALVCKGVVLEGAPTYDVFLLSDRSVDS